MVISNSMLCGKGRAEFMVDLSKNVQISFQSLVLG